MDYLQLKNQQSETFNAFPMFFAFNNSQFEDGLKKLGVEKGELLSITGGGFIRKTDFDAFDKMLDKLNAEMETAMENRGFLVGAIRYELANHEFCISFDPTSTLDLLNIDLKNPFHAECFNEAVKEYYETA